ncbi:MAG TPA: PadR family transcriptional regulator [Sporichthyaceae bacterium]
MPRTTSQPAPLAGRVNDPPLLILTSLASGKKHGYALMQDIAGFAGVTLGPGTLYGAIGRLEERGLIEPVGESDRRRPYRLTPAGSVALEAALAELRAILDEGAARLARRPAPTRVRPALGAAR